MKKTISYFSAMALTLAGGGPLAFAQEEAQPDKPDWKKDFSVTIGTKVWLNEWQLDRFFRADAFGTLFFPPPNNNLVFSFNTNTRDTAPDTLISEDVEPTPIPQLAVKYKRLFVTGSYYFKTNFDFPNFQQRTAGLLRLFDITDPTLTPILSSEATSTTNITVDGERREWDTAVGWYVHPYVAFLVGYKEINIETSGIVDATFDITTIPPIPPLNFSESFSEEIEISGPTLGIAASVPIVHGFGIYASYAHGFMDVDIMGQNPMFGGISAVGGEALPGQPFSSDTDADYDVAELGFSYTPNMAALLPHLPLSAATVYAGYRYQTIETDIGASANFRDRGDRRDITQGFVAGLNLTW